MINGSVLLRLIASLAFALAVLAGFGVVSLAWPFAAIGLLAWCASTFA